MDVKSSQEGVKKKAVKQDKPNVMQDTVQHPSVDTVAVYTNSRTTLTL
jgi:hypothetical protein